MSERSQRLAAERQQTIFGPEQVGTVADLRPGDFVRTLGGPGFHRYKVNASVEEVTVADESGWRGRKWVKVIVVKVKYFGHPQPWGSVSVYPATFTRPEATP